MTPDEKRIQWFGAIGHFLCHGYMLVFPAVLLLIAGEYGADLFHVGILGNVAYLAFGLGALPGGWLADRFGARKLVVLFLFGASATAFAISWTPSLFLLHVGFLALGIFCALYHPAGLGLISTIRDRGPAMAYHGVSGNLSIAAAPLIFGLLAASYGWRGAYRFAGIAGLVLACIAIAIQFHTPRTADNSPTRRERVALEGHGHLLILLYAITALNGFVYRGVLTYLPSWMAQVRGNEIDLARGGLVASAALIFGIGGQLIGGRLFRAFRPEAVLLVVLAMAAPLLWGIGALPWPATAVAAAGFVFLHFSTQPLSNGLIAQYTSSRRRSLGYGFSFALGFGAGSFSSSASGFVADRYGMEQVFPFLVGFVLVIIGIAVFLALRAARPGITATPDRSGG